MKAKKSSGLKNKYVFARAKKALGQNFLKSEIILRKIVEAGEIKPNDVILEIGPGRGALTEQLLAYSFQVIAVEKDRELVEFLKIKFERQIKNNNLVLVCGDILDFDIQSYKLPAKSYKLIANIPYNITGAILKKFLTADNQPESMVLMVQHEVATRILARDGKESLLSISVKAYGEPKMIAKVDKRYFSPVPKVNSAIIAIKNISRKIFTSPQPSPFKGEGGGTTVQDKTWNSQAFEQRFWEIVKVGFAHKRKKLSRNLKNICPEEALAPIGDKRAEDLHLSDWISLSKE